MQVLARGRGILLSDRVQDGGWGGRGVGAHGGSASRSAEPSAAAGLAGLVISARSIGTSAGALHGRRLATTTRAVHRSFLPPAFFALFASVRAAASNGVAIWTQRAA